MCAPTLKGAARNSSPTILSSPARNPPFTININFSQFCVQKQTNWQRALFPFVHKHRRNRRWPAF